MAKTEAEMMKGIPSQCKPGKGMAFYEKFYSYFSLDDDPCHEYTERLMINPIWAVPPTQVHFTGSAIFTYAFLHYWNSFQ